MELGCNLSVSWQSSSLVGMYLYAPLNVTQTPRIVNESQEVSSLMAERDRVINSLQELDFDFNLGKIPAGGLSRTTRRCFYKKARTSWQAWTNYRRHSQPLSQVKRFSGRPH